MGEQKSGSCPYKWHNRNQGVKTDMAEILIVEDEESINELICDNLKVVGHQCTQVYQGLEAKIRCKRKGII